MSAAICRTARFLRPARARGSHPLVAVALAVLLCACGPSPEYVPIERTVTSIHEQPLQTDPDDGAVTALDEARLVPRASYEIAARLLSTERYRLDALARVTPVDFALAWGPAADAEVQAALRIDQGNRWFYWRTRGVALPLARRKLVANMANVHIVPADEALRSTLLGFEAGECVWLRGELVDITSTSDAALARRTSVTRTDTGAGSCEILLVREAASIPCE